MGFPLRTDTGGYQIVQGLEHNDFAKGKIALTINELKEERDAVKELIPS